jgi:hypothetical protein
MNPAFARKQKDPLTCARASGSNPTTSRVVELYALPHSHSSKMESSQSIEKLVTPIDRFASRSLQQMRAV